MLGFEPSDVGSIPARPATQCCIFTTRHIDTKSTICYNTYLLINEEFIMQACNFINKYNASNTSTGFSTYDKVKATEKWLEYALDVMDMQDAMMRSLDFNEKYMLAQALVVAERKKDYMYRHKNFDLKRASMLFSAVKNKQKVI
jgi:hypothetical protein